MKPIEYAEYKEVLDVLQRDNVENSYEELMKKEGKTLDTINNVVRYYKDLELADGQLINQSIHTIFMRFFDVWNNILEDIVKIRSIKDIKEVFTKGDRIIFIGITLILVAFIIILLQNSNNTSS